MKTCAPSSTNLRAVAKPIPLLPPVITATFPANLVMVRPPGGMPFPSERRHFRANSPPVGWVVGPFYQTVRFEAVHQLRDVGPRAGELLGQLAEAYRPVLAHQDGQRLKFCVG